MRNNRNKGSRRNGSPHPPCPGGLKTAASSLILSLSKLLFLLFSSLRRPPFPPSLSDLNLLPLQQGAASSGTNVLGSFNEPLPQPSLWNKRSSKGNRKFQIQPETAVPREAARALGLSPPSLQALPSPQGLARARGSRRPAPRGRL